VVGWRFRISSTSVLAAASQRPWPHRQKKAWCCASKPATGLMQSVSSSSRCGSAAGQVLHQVLDRGAHAVAAGLASDQPMLSTCRLCW
jgi:hypothetical protein